MVEAGANQRARRTCILEALEIAHREIVKLCEAQDELRAKAGKPKWLDPASPSGSRRTYGHEIWARIQEQRHPRRVPRSSRRSSARKSASSRSSSTEAHVVRRAADAHVARADPREAALGRGRDARSASSSRATCAALTDAEQDSKELKSAKRHLLYERIVETRRAAVPGRPAGRRRPAIKDSLTKSYVKKACESIYKSLVRQKIAVDKRRPDGRSETEIRPIEVEVSVMPRTHGSGLFTRGQTQIMTLLTLGTAKEGQRIDDLSLETDRRYMHHYNFPPYSVGRDGPHGLAEAPRHRPRRARAAGARGGHPADGRTSRTRSASSPRRSSRTARRRWARCAARRSR